MKKIYSIAAATTLALVLSGCGQSVSTPKKVTVSDAVKLDVAQVCNVKANGVESVLATAKLYNPLAVKKQVEFMRFGASTRAYIKGVEEAIKSGSATANVKQKKKVVKFKIDFAAWRACTFAVSALQQSAEAESTWKAAVPSDGFKY